MFTISRSGSTAADSSVQVATANGTATATATATAGSDYSAVAATTVSFAADVTSMTVNVGVLGDTVDEPNETFSVVLSSPTGATIDDGTGIGTITNDDAGVGTIVDDDGAGGGTSTLAIDSVTVTEGTGATVNAVLTITRSGSTAGTSTVSYRTTGGTATAGSDYTASPPPRRPSPPARPPRR